MNTIFGLEQRPMLDLQALRTALAPLSNFGKDELTFTVGGFPVTIRPMLPHEEVAVQRYAATVLDENKEAEGQTDEEENLSRATALDYFDRFRIEVISHVIVQVGTLNLRGVRAVSTGERLENGVEVTVPVATAMRQMIHAEWSRGMLSLAFAKYGELAQKLALEADNIARKTLADIDLEILRLERRMETLREEREKRAKGDVNLMNDQIATILDAEQALNRSGEAAVDLAQQQIEREAQEQMEKAAIAAAVEEMAQRAMNPAPPVTPAPRKPVIPPSAPPPGMAAPENVPAKFMSSFADDADTLAEQNAQALFLARRAAMQAQEEELETDPLSRAQPIGLVAGHNAVRLPPQAISGRGKPATPVGKPVMNPAPKGTANPNFRPSK